MLVFQLQPGLFGRTGNDSVSKQQGMCHDEYNKYRSKDFHRFLHPAQVQLDKKEDDNAGKRKFVGLVIELQKRKDCISTGSDRNRDLQHIVDKERAAGDHAGLFTDGVIGNDISSTTPGKMLNNTSVCVRND